MGYVNADELSSAGLLLASGRRRKSIYSQTKPCCLHYQIQDVADASNVDIRKLQRYCKANSIYIRTLTLSDLVNLINLLRNSSSTQNTKTAL